MILFSNNKTKDKIIITATTDNNVFEFTYLKEYLISKDIDIILKEVKEDIKDSINGFYKYKVLNHVVCSIKDFLRD